MDLFQKAITVKLSHKDKYLVAEDDQESVSLDRDGSSKNAIWSVQFFETERYLRFKSCHGKYLTASDARRVVQSIPKKLDSSTQWEPIRDGFSARLRTPNGNFLQPIGGLPPWRNSVKHDVPQRVGTQEKVLWDVEVVEATPKTPPSLSSPSPNICRESTLITSFPIGRTPPTLEPKATKFTTVKHRFMGFTRGETKFDRV
ncbi:uncharacterized protein LOC131304683 [Rhododendron vialii]|uniref:uncharacterized protein LOC131304683 n=1 Tax=Rhododendron vialii TaxID=182163 RepID=UPI00265F64F6|nr:uncharacterized protein LOC131304683 [Rhododendron vialii]